MPAAFFVRRTAHMPLVKNQIIPLTIDALSSDGNGVGRFEGQAVFVPFAAVCVYTAYRPFMGSKNRESGMEFMEKDSLRMEFIQSIVRNGERKSQESNGTAYETVQAPVLKGQEAVE